METPFNIWLGAFLGWPVELIVVAETLLVIFGYALFLKALVDIQYSMAEAYENSTGFVAAFYWIIGTVAWIILLVLNTIHTILLIWFGYNALKDFRDWWHKG